MAVRIYGLLFVVLLAVSGTQATTEPAGVMETAKRELEEIKSTRARLEHAPRLELPRIASPELPGAAAPLPSPSSTTRRSDGREKKQSATSENWLLDAMLGDEALTEAEEKELILSGQKTEAELQLEKRFRLPGDKVERPEQAGIRAGNKTDDGGKQRSPPEKSPAVENPLTAFMGDWISRRDHDLLISKATSDGLTKVDNALDQLTSVGNTPSRIDPRPMSAEVNFDRVSHWFREPGPHASTDNPYLQAQLSPLPGFSMPPTVPDIPASINARTEPSPSAPALMESPGRNQRSESPAPDNVSRSENDAKYFPQLRRF